MATRTRTRKPPAPTSTNGPVLTDRRIDLDEFALIERIRSSGLTHDEVLDRLDGPAPRVRSGGFRFRTHHSMTYKPDDQPFLMMEMDTDIIITSRAAWMGMAESRLNCWSSALCGDDLVVGVRVARRDDLPHRGSDGDTEPEPEFTAELNRVRAELVRWVDGQDWITGASLNWGVNGRFSLDFVTDGPPVGSSSPWLIMEVQPHESVR
jgi:hypothetical protein